MSRVYFVGAGPGDPGLLTLRAVDALARCELVVHDATVHSDVLARCMHAARIVAGPAAAADLVAHARAGKIVARVASGDPLLFARGDEEVAAVARAGIAFEVIPGITAFAAAGAYAGLALTRTGDASPSVAVARVNDGEESLHDWAKLGMATDALALILPSRASLAEIARTLVFAGRSPETPAAAVARVSTPAQRIASGTLEDVARKAMALLPEKTEVLLIAGELASQARRDAIAWFDRRPLFGKRVLVTRAPEQAQSTALLLRERGAEPIALPTIELHPPSDPAPMQEAIADLASYAWVAFTSANGVERTWREIVRQNKDARAFGRAKIAAIGPGTAQALEAHGLRADVMAKEFKGEGLAEEMLRAMAPNARVLILRAQVARDALPDALRAAGCHVNVVAVYETRAAQGVAGTLAAELSRGGIDAVTFTSSSTVDNLCDLLGERISALAHVVVASIGPITTATAHKRGLRVDVQAATYTVPGLVDALEQTFAKK